MINLTGWVLTKYSKKTIIFFTKKWVTMTAFRFASYQNSKCSKFTSKYLCPSTQAVNAFSQDWSNEANWMVPTIYRLPKCLTHFVLSPPGTTGAWCYLVGHQLHYGNKSLRNLGPHIWNFLPKQIKEETNYNKFKNYIDKWFGAKCKCNLCSYLN